MENIIENNKLIAEFMGLSYCEKHQFEGWYKNHEHNHRICSYDGLKFHSSWDWLLPVVQKIYDLEIEDEPVLIIRDALADASLNGTFDAVVEFIEWHNQLKGKLEYLREELRAERISYGELAELQSMSQYIDFNDVELLEAAGVPEF